MVLRGKRKAPSSDRRGYGPKGIKSLHSPYEEESDPAPMRSRGKLTVSFEVPLPYRVLSKNWPSGDRRGKSEATKRYRQEVEWACREAMRKAGWLEPCSATVSLTFGTARVVGSSRDVEQAIPLAWQPYRPRDVWNAITAFHAGFDGITDAGLWPDDSHRWAALGKAHVDPSRKAGVRVFIQQRFS